MSVYKRPGQAEYSYDFRYRRQRFSGSTGCTSKREAEKVEATERERVKALQFDAGKPLSFEAGAAQYWAEVGQHHANAADTLRSLEWLQEQIGAKTMLAEIGDPMVAKAIAKRRGEGVSNATVNRTVTQPLRALLRRARRTWKQPVQDVEWKDHFLEESQERVREDRDERVQDGRLVRAAHRGRGASERDRLRRRSHALGCATCALPDEARQPPARLFA